MKNLFEPAAQQEVLQRLESLRPDSEHQWGKMNVGQMMAHCSAALETAVGKANPPQIFIGKILGPLFKKKFINEQPFDRNSPTAKSFIFTDERDFNEEREKLKGLIRQFSEGGAEKCTTHPHSFFGKLKPEEWAVGMYKHLDHHLRQFGA